jgi:isopentenyl-diphosphate delta-isomerase
VTLTQSVGFRAKTTGLERLEFVNNALPEVNLSEVDPAVDFLGHSLSFPVMISCMTGGYPEAKRINRELAEVCEEMHIAMGVGSQRQALEDVQYHETFSIVREVAPNIPVVGNIGAAEVAGLQLDAAKRLVDLVKADALAVHLNPLQEFLQPEGNTNFRGVLSGIARLVAGLHVPVIVKEIGAGISVEVARRLLDVGVRFIDVAGAGGTSWAGVETLRRKEKEAAFRFWDWGIPLSVAIREVATLRTNGLHFTLLASGGIASGMDIAKCLALGADIAASARVLLLTLHQKGKKGLRTRLQAWREELRGVMFLTGAPTVRALQHVPLVDYCTP